MKRVTAPKVRSYHLLQRWLTLRAMAASDVVLFPTQAMRQLVAGQSGGARPNWHVAPYGTRHELFTPSPVPSPGPVETVKLLHVSLYSDQKNLGTLLRALGLLRQREPGRYQLNLNAGFARDWIGESAFFPRFREEQALYRELAASGVARDTDWQAYGSLPDAYRSADIFVFPSYTESFGHPLVEAMACGLPVVAADVPVNRELCCEAAVYFSPFDVAACADAIETVACDPSLRARMRDEGLARVRAFTWERHVSVLLKALQGELS
jgi:glycosyltransferase involved in cell wall biosynthesis